MTQNDKNQSGQIHTPRTPEAQPKRTKGGQQADVTKNSPQSPPAETGTAAHPVKK